MIESAKWVKEPSLGRRKLWRIAYHRLHKLGLIPYPILPFYLPYFLTLNEVDLHLLAGYPLLILLALENRGNFNGKTVRSNVCIEKGTEASQRADRLVEHRSTMDLRGEFALQGRIQGIS